MGSARSQMPNYEVPNGVIGLKGPVEKPAPGTLPLRGDLAHMALAGEHLAAHYVIPDSRMIGKSGAELLLLPSTDAQIVAKAQPDTAIEVLDTEGDWVWACMGPKGPSGYCLKAALAPRSDAS